MENILTYKGHPLMRNGNTIYYGSLANKHIIVIKVLESKDLNDIKTATNTAAKEIANIFFRIYIPPYCILFSWAQKKNE